ncbi:hypothetical protein AVEN_155614-1 [Araneus ventricosus]|uniref:Endonuclease/exonuclease/phosphatase domain-containing protein n=1 Tax=Araneus ventricosus TaxID=182803 RepID=A0A4Y2RX23_ARAVE|nr:hypothetical protein AVEN_155614-1 [Araneus ventricosus]
MNRSNEVLRDGEYEEHRDSWHISLLGRKIAGLERKKYTHSDAPVIFTRNTSKGWPDLSLCTQQVVGEIANWEVLEEPSLSDH